MKKIITLVLIIVLVAPLVTGAQGNQKYSVSQVPGERTFVGVIDSINANEKSFVLRIGESVSLFQRFVAALFPSRGYIAPKYQVVTSENTLFQKKTTTGVAGANFDDLVVGKRVQVKGTYERLSTTNSQNNILGRITANYVFILSPSTSTSTRTSSTSPHVTFARENVFEGPIDYIDARAKSFVMRIDNERGAEVITTENTKFERIDMATAVFEDLAVGQRVQVTGRYEVLMVRKQVDDGIIRITASKVVILNPSPTTSSITTTSTTETPTTIKTRETTKIECRPICWGQGWVWSCRNPVTGVWEVRRTTLIKIDKFCKGCVAECRYQGTEKEGYYSSCDKQLIVSGCKSPFEKPSSK